MKKIILILLVFVLSAQSVLAISFNPDFIISDEEMFDYNSLDWGEIQKFLDNKDGVLKNLVTKDYNNKTMEAAAIIYQAAQEHKISPKVLLAKLQHEGSLIDNKKPSDTSLTWAMGYAVCDSCNIWDPKIALFGGFGQQVDYAARILRKYADKPELYNFRVGDTYTFSDNTGNVNPPYNKKTKKTEVTFANTATKSLYTYTPHVYTFFYNDKDTGETVYVGGNYNFWRIWNRWFGKSYPDGSLLQIKASDTVATEQEKQVVWLIKDNKRQAFTSKETLLSGYDLNKILYVTKQDLESYEKGDAIKYPNYSILESPDKMKYLIVNDKKRLISSDEVFKNIGFNPEEVITVDQADLDSYEDASPLTKYSIYPTGALLQNDLTGGVYYVESSLKQPIVDKSILEINFPNKEILKVSPSELDNYLTGPYVKFKDGNLITAKGDPAVYVISNGQRRPISSAKTFEILGYKWENIITVSKEAIEIHTLGDSL